MSTPSAICMWLRAGSCRHRATCGSPIPTHTRLLKCGRLSPKSSFAFTPGFRRSRAQSKGRTPQLRPDSFFWLAGSPMDTRRTRPGSKQLRASWGDIEQDRATRRRRRPGPRLQGERGGEEWTPKKSSEQVLLHDFGRASSSSSGAALTGRELKCTTCIPQGERCFHSSRFGWCSYLIIHRCSQGRTIDHNPYPRIN